MSSLSNNPVFAIIGGPNGVGKSTFAEIFLKGIPYINGDEIKRLAKQEGQRIDTFGLRILIQERVQAHIRANESFAMESNLVSNFSFEIVKDVAARSYSTNLYYIGATDVNILNQRIDGRVGLGLHYVSPEDVQIRYNEALAKLPSNLKLFDKTSLLDNSRQGSAPVEVLQLERGIVVWESTALPQWLERILPSIRRLSMAYQTLKSRSQRDIGMGL